MYQNIGRVLLSLALIACAMGVSRYVPGSGANHKCVPNQGCGLTSQACISANHPSGTNPQNICIYCTATTISSYCGAQDGNCPSGGAFNCGFQWISTCSQVPWNAPYGTCTGGIPAGTGSQSCVVFKC